MKRILFIVGSLRENSLNRQLSHVIAEKLAGWARLTWLSYQDIPYMNQDREFPVPQEIKRIREAVRQADGIWIVTPEYNHSYPGLLKNLLDWLSRSVTEGDPEGRSAIVGKKVTISSAAGRSAGSFSREKLTELLKYIGADLMKESQTGVSLSREAYMTDRLLLDVETEAALDRQAEMFIKFLEAKGS